MDVEPPYRKYPSDPPGRRTLWILAALLALILIATLAAKIFGGVSS